MAKNRLDHDQICKAALRVFARYGFKRTRMEDVAAELDVAAGTLYRYVTDKRDLYQQAVARGLLEWQNSAKAAIDPQAPAIEQLRSYLLGGYDYLGRDDDLRTTLVGDPSFFPLSPKDDPFQSINRLPMTSLKQILFSGVQSGEFRSFDVDTIAELFYSIFIMFIIKTYVKAESQSTRQMLEASFELMCTGILNS